MLISILLTLNKIKLLKSRLLFFIIHIATSTKILNNHDIKDLILHYCLISFKIYLLTLFNLNNYFFWLIQILFNLYKSSICIIIYQIKNYIKRRHLIIIFILKQKSSKLYIN